MVGCIQSKESQGFLGRTFEWVGNVFSETAGFVKDTGRKIFGGKKEQEQVETSTQSTKEEKTIAEPK